MRNLGRLTLVGGMAAGALALTTLTASAAIVCNTEGDCWHVQKEYVFPPAAHVTIHPDTWHWGPGQRFAFREHEGRGYWRGGVWVGF